MLWPASVQIYGLKNSMRHKEGLFVQDRHLMKPGLRIGSTKRLPMCLQCHNIYLHSRSSECHRLTKSIAMSNKISKCVWTAIPLTQSPQQQQYVVVLVIIIYRSTAFEARTHQLPQRQSVSWDQLGIQQKLFIPSNIHTRQIRQIRI